MSFPLFAEERSIKVQKHAFEGEWRSLTFPPTVTLDGNILRIYSDVPLDNLQATITDLSTGNAFRYDNITVLPGQPYTLFLEDAESGTYKIELKVGHVSYYGLFEL